MKIKTIAFVIAFSAIIAGISTTQAQGNVRPNVNFNELNSYGEWVIVAEYGTVWRPDADPSWRPFTYGRWAYTNDGWAWDADEPFGWIVFHYGNWLYDNEQGWVWLPGNQWSPARVKWHVTDNEIGWAPLSPPSRRGYHHNAIQADWIFSPVSYFTSDNVRTHITFRANNVSGRNSVRVYAGPPQRSFVQRKVNTPIVSIRLNKVRVTTPAKPLIRVEIQRDRNHNGEMPIGPRYKRVIIHGEQNGQMNSPEEKNQVRPRDNDENRSNQNHSQDDNNNDKKKVKVEVHTR